MPTKYVVPGAWVVVALVLLWPARVTDPQVRSEPAVDPSEVPDDTIEVPPVHVPTDEEDEFLDDSDHLCSFESETA